MVASGTRGGDPTRVYLWTCRTPTRWSRDRDLFMPRTPRRFPIAFRSCAVVMTLVAVIAAATPTGAGAAPSSQQVQDAKDRVASLLAQLRDAKAKLAAIDQQLAAAAAEVDKDQAALEKVTADLLTTQRRLTQTQARHDD